MGRKFKTIDIPPSRIATFDVFSLGIFKHHVAALLEFDVTDSRKKIRALRRSGRKVSFNAWLIKAISETILQHPEASAFLQNKRKLILFNDINVSMLVEKQINDTKVPIPLVIEKTNEKSIEQITNEIKEAEKQAISNQDFRLNKPSKPVERLYYRLPGFLRRMIWKYYLCHPKTAFRQMGNVVITSLGMMGKINGWFIHKSIHPVSFGIGAIIKKPVVVGSEIKIREVLNMTVLIDHDVMDGAPMARFIKDLARNIEQGKQFDEGQGLLSI